ncbi:hypothetical protein [Kocuria nitroreducens]|uniref:hypothetical protein n=1 Tax=Kocuria nitroreducens TaxID=3058914 RepID=UPI0036DC5F4D
MILELVAAETERAGKLHASIRHIASWVNLQKNTAQKRVSSLRQASLIEQVSPGGVWGSAAYRITGDGVAALKAFEVPAHWTQESRNCGMDTEGNGTWYKGAPVPDAMRTQGLRGGWELWRTLPHIIWLTPEDALPYVTATTARSVRNWTKALVNLDIPLAEWGRAGTQFRLLDADPGVFDQLRLVQEHEAAQQGQTLASRATLDRSYLVERIRADEALDRRENPS